jgi:hypothetical protein
VPATSPPPNPDAGVPPRTASAYWDREDNRVGVELNVAPAKQGEARSDPRDHASHASPTTAGNPF